jgi:ureidoglycolate hydrolase
MTTTQPLAMEALTVDAWLPFGAVPADEGSANDTADLEFLWADGHVNFIAHAYDEIERSATGAARCDLLNRHDTHTQTLMPMGAAAVIVVAPATVAFARPDDLDHVRAFRLEPFECVHLARGTWHWGPFPVAPGVLRCFNVQGRGYPRDNAVARLGADLGVVLEVGP